MREDFTLKRLQELALRAAYGRGAQFTRFLEPSAWEDARRAAGQAGVHVGFYGGYPGSERCLAAFFDGDEPEIGEWPVTALRLEWNAKFARPAHRDLLGAVMGLGIERETTGDIAMGTWRGDDCAYLFCAPEVADYLCRNLQSAGRAALKVSVAAETPSLKPPEGTFLRITVQNERLDAVLAAACRLSRSEAQRLVAAGLVKLNHVPCLRGDARLSEGDLISARGFGRVRVDRFDGESRRGRHIVTVFCYGKPE